MPRLLPLLLLAAFATTWLHAAPDDNRYAARFANGTLVTNHEVQNLFQEGQEPNIKGQRFFDPGNPIRTLWDTTQHAPPVDSGLELANGDIIPGEIVTHVPASATSPAHFLVRLPDLPNVIDHPQIAVREGDIRRYWSVRRDNEDFQPGLAAARDGRKWTARAIRYSGGSVQLLTGEGISNVTWSDLARVDFLSVDPVTALQRESIWSTQPGAIVRVKSRNGAEITFPRPFSMKTDAESFYARPTWALIPLKFVFKEVVSYAFRERQEVPLSLLPVAEMKQLAGLHEHGWRRNVMPDGRMLKLGDWTHDLGLALHAPQEITFELPKGAETFKAKIGVPHLLKQGCVKCRIHRDSASGPKLWESDFLRGGDSPVDVQVNLDNAPRLTLVVDMAHDGRPAGADPLDIRDDVVWLDPIVKIRDSDQPDQTKWFSYFQPALAGWELNAEASKFVLAHAWLKDKRMFEAVLTPKEKSGPAPQLELHRQVNVNINNARFILQTAKGGEGGNHGQQLTVKLNGEPLPPGIGTHAKTFDALMSKPNERDYSLGPYLGKKVDLTVVVEPQSKEASEMFGLWVRKLELCPIIDNVASSGKLLTPNVPLESLKPVEIRSPGPATEPPLTAGKTTKGAPLNIRGCEFATGFSVLANAQITYALDEKFTRFVAVIGLAEGTHVGPYTILLDDQPFWQDKRDKGYDKNDPGLQLDLAIPAGHKKITIKVGGRDGEAAWAQAGFVTN
jgi:hypothetical protein